MNIPLSILLVDSSAINRAIYQNWLSQNALTPFTFLEADCGDVGVKICQTTTPNLLLLSDCLHDMDELEVLGRLQQQALQHVPVVILSEQEDVAAAVRAMKHGAQNYLVKSKLTSAILYDTVCEAISEQLPDKFTQTQNREASSHILEQPAHMARKIEDHFASAILDVVGALVVVLDCRGRIVCFNQVCEQVSGYTFAEVEGKSIWDLVPSEEFEAVNDVFDCLWDGQFPNQHENHWVTKDGDRRLISWSNTASVNAKGIVEAVIGTGIDITESRQMEIALRLSEEQRRLAVDLTHVGTWDWQMTTGRISWSNSQFRLLGLFPGETDISYETWRDRVHPEDIEQVEQIVSNALTTKTDYEAEYRVIHPNGSVHWIVARGKGLYDDAGLPIRMLGIVMDISDRKRIEAEREQAEALLRHSEATNRAIIQAIPDLLIRMTSTGRCLDIISCRTMKGAYPKCAIQDSATFTALFPDLSKQKQYYVHKALNEGELQVYEQAIQIDNSTQFEEVRIAPSGPDEVLVIVRDISERKQAEIALQESEARFHAFMNNSPTASWITDTNGQILYVSQTYCQTFNLPTENLIGKTVFELYSAEIAQQFLTNIQWVAETGQVMEIVETAPKRDGTLGEFLVYKFPLQEMDRQRLVGGVAVDITERLLAERALRQLNQELEHRVEKRTAALRANEAILQAVFNQAAVGMNLTNPEGRFIKVNQAFCDILGYAPEELLQTDFIQITYPEDQERSMQERHRLLSGEANVLLLEKRYIRKNGSPVWVSITVSTVHKNSRETDFVICVVEDIHQRKQIELQLRHSEARYRAIVEDQTELIARFGLDTTILFVNEAYCRYFGVEREEIIGTSYTPNIFEVDQEQVAQLVQSMSFENPTVAIENRFIINGEIRWTQWINRMLFDNQGNFIEYQAVGRDITARKQAESKLQRQLEREILVATITQRIRESLDLLTILNTTVAEIQQLLQADRVLVYRLLQDGSGQTIAESRNSDWQPLLELGFSNEIFPPESYQRYLKGHVYVLSNRDHEQIIPCMVEFMQTFNVQAKLVAPIVHQNILWGLLIVHQCSAPRKWQGWEVQLIQQLANQLAIATKQSELYQRIQFELREREQTQQLLEQSNTSLRLSNLDLARATRHKDEFLANMSHELRTPLNAILGMSEALLEEICGPLTERQQRAITTIANSGTHLLELINDILDLSKIEAGKLELQMTSVAISLLCESSLTFVKPMADKKGIQLIAQIPSNIGEIEADNRRLQQVLINLLSNAVKFTPVGGSVTLKAWLEGSTEAQATEDPDSSEFLGLSPATHSSPLTSHPFPPTPHLCLSISDTGIGIAQEDFERIFQPFQQLDSSLSRQYTGTGLGLALVKRLVKMHQGIILVESKIGEGSRFTIQLPQHQVDHLILK